MSRDRVGRMSGAFTHRQVAYRLLPGRRGVWRRLERVLEAQRQLHNAALREGCDAWRLAGRSISYIDRAKSLTVCRREDPEMAVVPVQRGTLKRLDEAMKGFFRRVKAGQRHPGFPRFRSRRGFDSIAVVSGVRPVPACPDSIRVSRGQAEACLRLPGFGPLTVRRRGGNPHGRGAPVSAVLKRTAGKWCAIVCFRIPAPVREDDGSVIGVDMNAGQAAASDGRLFQAPDAGPAGGGRRLEGRAKRLSRRLARRKRGSGRRERTRTRLAKTKRRLAGMRRDWRHHVLRALADAAFTVAVEDLRVRSMTRSARGAAEEPAPAPEPCVDASLDASSFSAGYGVCGQAQSCVRPLCAAFSTPRACMEIGGPGPYRGHVFEDTPARPGFPDPVSLTVLSLPLAQSCLHPEPAPDLFRGRLAAPPVQAAAGAR